MASTAVNGLKRKQKCSEGKYLGTVDQNNTPASGDVAINLVVRNYHTSVASEPGRETIWLHEQKVGCHANEI